MTWWVITLLSNTRSRTSLFTRAHTSHVDHLFMAWAHYKPRRHPIYRTVRGVEKLCGYTYIWDTPNITEQLESGNTITHTFLLTTLPPTAHTWYYLFAPGGPYGLEIQGPLIHIPPWETTMPSARVTNSAFIPIPPPGWTLLGFDTVRWDDAGFYHPGTPSILKAPLPGLYEVGASINFDTTTATGIRMRIVFNGTTYIVAHTHPIGPNGWEGTAMCISTPWPFDADDYIQLAVRQFNDAGALILKQDAFSPEFWITYLGPNPT